MSQPNLTEDLNIVSNSDLTITYMDGNLDIIQQLDDEPNDVGGLTAAELKAKFDEAGNIIKSYINGTLIPEILAADATEEARAAAEAQRETNEAQRIENENTRIAAEQSRASAETARDAAEQARVAAEEKRVSDEASRMIKHLNWERQYKLWEDAEEGRVRAESSRAAAEQERDEAETSRVNAELNRRRDYKFWADDEASRKTAEQARVAAEEARVAAEQARADENTGIVARATEQANLASSAAASSGNSATEAAASESAAASSASGAAGSAAAASASEINAKASETAAKASENAAKASETSAKESATTAKSEADRAKSEADRAAGIVGGDYATKTDLSAHTGDAGIHVTAEEKTAWSGKAEKAKCVSVTLSASGWDSTAKTQTVTVTGISATETDQMITPVPALASQAAYYDAGIKRTAQEADSLTFTADTVPTSDMTVYVVIMEVSYSAPAATLINFTINSTSFQAEEGMTWNEWIGSGYDTKNVLCVDADTGFVNSISNYGLYDDVLNQVKGTDAIASGSQYYVSGPEIP